MTAPEITLYAEFTAKPGDGAHVAALISDYADIVRAEPGNVTFEVYRRAESPNRFFVLETYRDRAAFDAHLGAEAGRRFNDALGARILEPSSVLSFLTRTA